MKYIWDEEKRRANIAKHGLDFVDAVRVLEGLTLTTLDYRTDYGEDRQIAIGWLDGRLVTVVVFTEPEEDVIRIVSFRKATTDERRKYERSLRDRLGEG